MNEYENLTPMVRLIDGYRIETTQMLLCVSCLVGGGEDQSMGLSINTDDKMIHIEQYIVVHPDSCDYIEDHVAN